MIEANPPESTITKNSMASFFYTKAVRKDPAATTSAAAAAKTQTSGCSATQCLKSEDPVVQAFYDQLTDKERIAHTIAVEKLGTSYDVVRTHGFLRYLKNRG